MVTASPGVTVNKMTGKEDIQTERSQSARKLPTSHKIRGCHLTRPNSARISQLAIPKDSKAVWSTSFGPRLIWGNQEPMWPISPAALRHIPSARLQTLAQPKLDYRPPNTLIPEYQYSCGRESQIWKVQPSTQTAVTSERINYLSRHKTVPEAYLEHRYQFVFGCGRSSPIWRPSKAAMTALDRPRTANLARPKLPHPNYQPPRQVQTIVSSAAKQYVPSLEIEKLATPKVRPDGPFREPEWPVTKGALQAESSQRLTELARPKRLSEGYEPNRDVVWKVSVGAKTAVASSRLSELAKPIVRETMDHVQFDPDAFLVSEAAKKAKASSRIEELAQPIQRGH